MENISQIKSGFIEYLIDKYGEEESEKIESYTPEMSIFMYSRDFQKYLVDNGYADVSIFSQSIEDIKEQLTSSESQDVGAESPEGENTDVSIVPPNGEGDDNFIATALTDVINQDEDLFAALNTNENEVLDMDEITAFLDTVDAAMQEDPDSYDSVFDGIAKEIQNIKGIDNSEMSVEEVLKSIYDSDAAQKYLDLDGDGEISDDEKELFEKFVQGDKDELTSEDLQKALEEMENGTFKYDAKLPENKVEVEKSETEKVEDNQNTQKSTPMQSSGSSGGGRVNSGAWSNSSGNNATSRAQTTPSNPEDMNLEQLKEEQATRQDNVDSAKDDVDSTISEIDEVEAGEYADAKTAYEEALENDENISDELKEKISQNLEQIESKNSEIDSINSQIAETEVSLGQANDKLDADEKNLSALKSALSSYDGASSDDPNEQAKIDNAKQQLQSQIDTLENQTIPKDKEERDRLDKLLNGGGEEKGLKDQLAEKQDELKVLEEEKATLEASVLENCSEETKLALENFKQVEQKLSDLRASLPDKQSALVEAQEQLTEINELIRTKEAEKVEAEESHFESDLPAELVSALDAKLGKGFCAKLEQVAKNINCDPKDLLGMMQSESGIDPTAYNSNGGATGLIQFMPRTAESLGTTTDQLRNMSGVEQLDYVEQFFVNWTGGSGQRLTGGDLYTLCFLPAFINQETLCSSSDGDTAVYYNANSGLDANGDGRITKTELSERVSGKYQEVLDSYGISG